MEVVGQFLDVLLGKGHDSDVNGKSNGSENSSNNSNNDSYKGGQPRLTPGEPNGEQECQKGYAAGDGVQNKGKGETSVDRILKTL
jgi:hypothetical protein